MSEIHFSHYTLEFGDSSPREAPRNLQHGVLIAFDGGYSTLQPWQKLGDPPLEELLRDLRHNRKENLVKRSLELAALDGEFRRAGHKAFDGLDVCSSHILYNPNDLTKNLKGSLLKIKLERNWRDQIESIESLSEQGCHLRLDSNMGFSYEDVREFWSSLSPTCKKTIDVFEDPCDFDKDDWNDLFDLGIPIAVDWASPPPSYTSYKARIIKPARDDVFFVAEQEAGRSKELIVTSYLTHPLDQVTACWFASKLATLYPTRVMPAGYISTAYRSREFKLEFANNKLIVPNGTGFGFDAILENLAWTLAK